MFRMSRLRVVSGFGVVMGLAMLASAVPLRAASWIEQNVYLSGPRYDGALPPCEAGLSVISGRFADNERRYWNSAITILGFDRVREVVFRPWGPNALPRRFCTAVAALSDGALSPVHYAIGEDTGFAGATWGVEWCVVGYDRNGAYSPACKAAQP